MSENSQDLKVRKVKGFSAFHNFRYEKDGLHVWKAFGVGEGKLILWNKISSGTNQHGNRQRKGIFLNHL